MLQQLIKAEMIKMVKLYSKDKDLTFLKNSDRVFWSNEWNVSEVRGKAFRCGDNSQVEFERVFRVKNGNSFKFPIDDDSGLIPQHSKDFYEIHFGLKGNVLAYWQAPLSDYLHKLQKSGYRPDPTDEEKKFLGTLTEEDTPAKRPRWVFYTANDMNPHQVELSNRNSNRDSEKVILRFIINKVHLEKQIGKKKPSGAFRYIPHYNDEVM